MTLQRTHGKILSVPVLNEFGLNAEIIRNAIEYTQEVLDRIDVTLVEAGGGRFANMIELANLSAVVGNLFRTGVSKASNGAFISNDPHKFPDLLAVAPELSIRGLEIKVALEKNKPKGHLIKPGPHLTVRYVLADENGQYIRGKENRGAVVWIWEVRVGELKDEHFSFSNTPGDSGKTAVINKEGMGALRIVFFDIDKCPYAREGPFTSALTKSFDSSDSKPGYSRNKL